MSRLGIVVTHPIQYYTPLFAHLAAHLDMHVFYGFAPDAAQRGAAGFAAPVDWGIDLLHGHPHSFLANRSRQPGTDRFDGIDTPEVGDALQREGISHLLVLGWQCRSYWQAKFAAARLGIPTSVRGDSCHDPRTPAAKRLLKRLAFPLFLRRYRRIFYVGQRNRDYLLAHGAPAERLAFFPHAVDQAFWTPGTPAPITDGARFLWVGKLIDVKRPLDAIAAFLRASSHLPSMHLDIVGTGPLEGQVRAAIQGHPNIRLLGFRDQPALRALYRASHCLLVTSERETWALVVSEALACGLPVIASDGVASATDLVVGRGTGATYRMGDTEALACSMLRLVHALSGPGRGFAAEIARVNHDYHFHAGAVAVAEFLAQPARRAGAQQPTGPRWRVRRNAP
jgi:glycosyltransferase involved in cell wall biosynthesis